MGDCPDKMHQNHTAQFEYPILKPDEKKKARNAARAPMFVVGYVLS